MTVVVAFLCSDGAVIAADSMITSSIGQINVAHHTGRKVAVIRGNQLFAWAGDQGLGARFQIMADGAHTAVGQTNHAIDYPLQLSQALIAQFQATGIGTNMVGVNTVLAFLHRGDHQCCVFEGPIQPRLLDQHHFYVAIGSGKLAADPFLRFLVDAFCPTGLPTVREAIFLATWVIEHVIHTNPGGVAGPIRMAVLERNGTGVFGAREVPDTEIEEHRQAVESAVAALRSWRDGIQSGAAAAGVPEPPATPVAGAI
jgi:20S proteasome alpha/beta subunit